MKKKEVKKLTKTEILKNLDKLKRDLFNFRFQKVNSQVTNPAKINETKKNPCCRCNCDENHFEQRTFSIPKEISGPEMPLTPLISRSMKEK